MKIVLLLLSSAMLAVLCYAAFRENVTEFYDYIDSIEKPFNEDKFFKRFEQEAQEINLYSKNKEDKKALKKLLKKSSKRELNNLALLFPDEFLEAIYLKNILD